MVTETDRNKARSAVVSAYHALDCVTIPLSFLHAFADAAVDALSTDAEPFGWTSKHFNEGEEHRKWGRRRENVESYEGYIVQALYAEPVKTAPAVAVKALEWVETTEGTDRHASAKTRIGGYEVFELSLEVKGRGMDSHSRVFCGWTSPFNNGDTPAESFEKAKSAAQADYEARIRSALSAQVQDVAVDGADIGWCIRSLSVEHPLKWADAEKKPGLRGWFVGQVMKHFDGKPDEKRVRELIDIVFAMYPASPASKHGDAE